MAIRDDYSAFEDFGGLDYFTPEESYQPAGSYYTYGSIPSVMSEEEPVFVPRDESVLVSPLEQAPMAAPIRDTRSPGLESVADYLASSQPPVSPPEQAPTAAPIRDTRSPGPMPPPGPNLAGDDDRVITQPTGETVPVTPISAPLSTPVPAPTATEPPKTDIFAAMKAFGAAPSIIAPLAQAGTGGKDLTAGDLFKNERERFVSDYEKQVAALKAAGNFTPENDEALKATLNYQLDRLTKDETNYLNTLPQRQELSNLLKANKFSEAYQYAKDNGLQLLLTQPTELKNLRDPFTKEEARQFIRAMPEEFIKSAYGDRYKFDEAFKFDPEGAESRGALSWVSGIGPEGPIASETGYPMLDRILQPQEVEKKPGIFQDIFKAAALAAAVFGGAQALGALSGGAGTGAGALTGVTPTGLVPGTTAANLAAAKTAAAGAAGAGASALPTFTVTAGGGLTGAQLAALGAAGAGAGGLGGGAGTAPTTTTPPPDNLQEILVQAAKPKPYSLLGPGTLASTSLIQGTTDVPVDIYGRPTEPPQPPEEEIVVRGTKPPVSPIDLTAVGGLGALGQTLSQQLGYKPPGLETTPVKDQGLPEVVVTGTKPPVLDIADVALGLGGAGALTAGFTQPQVDPLTGKLKEPPKTQQELDAIQEALRTGKPIPGTASALDQAKSVLEKANTARKVANLLKSLGLLGAGAAAGGRGTAAPVTGAGGFGGALPKFQLQRTPLQPQVDYYRYGLGPEARFFEDKMVEVKPSEFETTEGPATGIVNPKDRPPVFAEGGLAKGGRYMEGPGSGRDDKIPALLSDGEYVIDAETLALLGDGSPKEGAKRMDQFRANIRRHKGDALSRGRISPDAKSPSKYMGGGLTR